MTVSNKNKKFFGIYLIVIIIAMACVLMNGPMRGGLPVDPTVPERMAFIAEYNVVWTLSWIVWMLAALGLLVFCFIFASVLNATTLAVRLGLTLVALGIVPDLIAEVIYAFVMPQMLSLIHI